MCAVDDADPCDVWHAVYPTARKRHVCEECQRSIQTGETYRRVKMLYEGYWSESITCAHCEAAGAWMGEVCGGYLGGGLDEELREHWSEGYASILLGRLILGMRERWHHGADPVPDVERVRAVARWSMARKVDRLANLRVVASSRAVQTVTTGAEL
jgi:hypothetical protein